QSEEKQLRLKVELLLTNHRIVLEYEVHKYTLAELRHIVDAHRDYLNCNILDFDDMYENHGCKTCIDNPTGLCGEYPSPPDGSGVPQIPGLFPSGPISVEDVNRHRFRYITSGTTCGLKKVPGTNTRELALFVHFPDFFSLPPEGTAQLERLAYLIHLGASNSSPCKSNGPQNALPKELRGDMNVVGNRKAYDNKPFGPYALGPGFKTGQKRAQYLNFQKHCVPEIAVILNRIFQNAYSSVVAEQARQFGQEFHLPPLGSISIDETTWEFTMGCNLTISFKCFSNEAHLDKDKYRYVFSVYVFVDRATGQLVTDSERIAKCMEGGYLIWPDVHLALRIVRCTGAVILLWRGTHERHSTILSNIVDDSVIRYGTSLQVNKRLFNLVQQYHKQLEALERWEQNGGQGECPPIPHLPTDLNDL
ncbi:hypothetical protein FRC07_013503, partial [Ceratobasidium sp. 392]